MNTRATRTLLAACALLTGTAFATPPATPPGVQKGAAGLVTAFYLRQQLPWHLDVLTYGPRDIADRALRILAPVTSPSAVMNTPAGVTVPCPKAGSITARISRNASNTLKLQWTGCVYEIYGWDHTLTGSGEIALTAFTFTPAAVAGIKLGDRQTDLVEELVMLQSTQTVPDVHTRNLRMTGHIPLERAHIDDIFPGALNYQLTGFFEERTHFMAGGAGDQLFESKMTLSAQNLAVNRLVEFGLTNQDDIRVQRGKLEYVSVSPQILDQPSITTAYSIEGQALRVRRTTNYQTSQHTFSIDGTARVDFPDFYEFDCHACTDFTYRTAVVAQHAPNHEEQDTYSAGEIWINGNTRARFTFEGDEYGYGSMNVDLNVRGRRYDFTVPAGGWGALAAAAACN